MKFILARGKVTLEDVCDFVKQTKLSHVELGQEEVLQIVNTLVYDGKVDAARGVGAGQGADPDDRRQNTATTTTTTDYMENVIVVYRPASLPIPKTSAFTAVPCGVCPVFQECAPGGLVSPGDVPVHAGLAQLLTAVFFSRRYLPLQSINLKYLY